MGENSTNKFQAIKSAIIYLIKILILALLIAGGFFLVKMNKEELADSKQSEQIEKSDVMDSEKPAEDESENTENDVKKDFVKITIDKHNRPSLLKKQIEMNNELMHKNVFKDMKVFCSPLAVENIQRNIDEVNLLIESLQNNEIRQEYLAKRWKVIEKSINKNLGVGMSANLHKDEEELEEK